MGRGPCVGTTSEVGVSRAIDSRNVRSDGCRGRDGLSLDGNGSGHLDVTLGTMIRSQTNGREVAGALTQAFHNMRREGRLDLHRTINTL